MRSEKKKSALAAVIGRWLGAAKAAASRLGEAIRIEPEPALVPVPIRRRS